MAAFVAALPSTSSWTPSASSSAPRLRTSLASSSVSSTAVLPQATGNAQGKASYGVLQVLSVLCGALAVRKLGKQPARGRGTRATRAAVCCDTQAEVRVAADGMSIEQELQHVAAQNCAQKLAPKIHALQCQAEQLRNGELRAVLDAARKDDSKKIRGAFGEVDMLLGATIDAISDSTHSLGFNPQGCESNAYVDCAPPSPRTGPGSVERKLARLAPKIEDLRSQAELLRNGELRQVLNETRNLREPRFQGAISEVDFLLSATIDAIQGLPLQYA